MQQIGLYQDLLKHHSTFCDGGSVDEEGNMLSCRHILPAHCAIQRLVSNHSAVFLKTIQYFCAFAS